jgi:Protein of unknown function (DUF2934)
MVFIQQRIQSFLNIGACKEYPIMAKVKTTKKITDVSAVPTTAVAPAVATAIPTPLAVRTEAIKVENSEPRKVVGKPAIVKTDSRSNLVPINLEDEIRRLAYLMAERRGFEFGHEAEDWLAAEHEILQRYHQQSA